MGKAAHNDTLDGALNKVAEADEQAVCSAEPQTYYEAKDPSAWQASTAYALGDVVRPTTRNGYAYECTAAGTSGASEPTWPTTPGNTVGDGSVTWTCRNNYALANASMSGGDFTNADGDTSGRKVTIAQKADVSIHTDGTANHIALLDDGEKELRLVTTCTSQVLTSGNTVTIPAYDFEIGDPT